MDIRCPCCETHYFSEYHVRYIRNESVFVCAKCRQVMDWIKDVIAKQDIAKANPPPKLRQILPPDWAGKTPRFIKWLLKI